jgi:hypothetical protein
MNHWTDTVPYTITTSGGSGGTITNAVLTVSDTFSNSITTSINPDDPAVKEIGSKIDTLSEEVKELFLFTQTAPLEKRIETLESKVEEVTVLLKEVLNEIRKRPQDN